MKCRIIRSKRPAVLAANLVCLLVNAPRIRVLLNANRNSIHLAREKLLGHIKPPTYEAAFDPPQLLAVQKDIRFPVDPIEVQPGRLLRPFRWSSEFRPIPEVR